MAPEDTRLEDDIPAIASVVSPVSTDVLAEVLEAPEARVVATVEELVASGAVIAGRHGVSADTHSVSPTRHAFLARRLAEVLQRRGSTPLAVGTARWAAGEAGAAYDAFNRALDEPDASTADLLDLTITAGKEAGLPVSTLAPLLVRRAQQRRNRGETEAAMADLDEATRHLTGEPLVDALGFAAAIHDDRQRPADAESTVAMALLSAATGGLPAKQGSLLTMQGRMLSRLGFDREADDVFAKGLELVRRHGTAMQGYFSGLNQAWTDLDRGWVARAEQRYTVARTRSESFEDRVSTADKDIAIARARFLTGDGTGAEAALESARKVAEESGAPVLRFLGSLAEAEGAIAFGQAADAVAAADRFRMETVDSFPQWTNRAAAVQARARLTAGDRTGARRFVEEGLATTPAGANGLRLRTELEALQLLASERWDPDRAADVADRLLQGGWLLVAVGLLTERAARESRPDLARTAAALAHRIGAPLAAADAVEAGDLWSDPASGTIALAIRGVTRAVPRRWEEAWLERPAIVHALSTDIDAVTTDDNGLATHLDEVLASVGLSGDVLSPAQRRSAGLVRAGKAIRSAGRFALWLVGVATVAAVVVIALRPAPVETIVTVPAPTTIPTTTTLPLLERVVPSDSDLGGQDPYAGGDTRNALLDARVGSPVGIYWRVPVTGFIQSDPVLRGRSLYVGTSQGYLSALDILGGGSSIFETRLPGAIASSTTVEQVQFQQDDQGKVLAFIVDDRGTLVARPINDTEDEVYRLDLGSPATGPPLVRSQSLIVATADGRVLDLYPADGTELARFPLEGTLADGFAGPLAAADGVVYVRTGSGSIILLDEATLTEICRVESTAGAATTSPVISDGLWFIGTTARSIRAFDQGRCTSGPIPSYLVGTPVNFPPAISDGLMWTTADAVLQPIDIVSGAAPFVSSSGGSFTSPPVVTSDLVLVSVGSELVAFDRADGEVRWQLDLGDTLRQRPVVADGLIIVATEQEIIAIAAPPTG